MKNKSIILTIAIVMIAINCYAQVVSTAETVTDADGNIYNSVKIGTQTWMKANLVVTTLNDGKEIPMVTDDYEWQDLTAPGYCAYGNGMETYADEFGLLYNWYAVNTKKLCPIGWHVSTDAEWMTLTTYLGGADVAAGKLKSISGWNSPDTVASNSSGFTALPGGCRNDAFRFNGDYGYWWSSTGFNTDDAWFCYMYSDGKDIIGRASFGKDRGLSVRCVKD
ncbi:MAG: fibrobacter succinogenes major paralogous domain-containing protein [Bacteroidales bacterium]|nr:fibrobacter succinogenes major paralogous domain-containing protein [Bacteroidales bacterium]